MKTIVINCSPVSGCAVHTVVDDVVTALVSNISYDKIACTTFALVEGDTDIYIKGNPSYAERIKKDIEEKVLSYNNTYNIRIKLI
jgi:hypothetical protein